MKLKLDEYKDKVKGCYVGKNIGGTFGAPFECKRQINTVDFYTQDLSMGPPPNDDLDLQIIWLNAVERYGRNVDAHILGEYWLSYIVPNWVEYGMAKANLRAALTPPLSGVVDNTYGNSNGAFIRSEIWACLAPGHPEIAVKYAYEDAILDHHSEGVLGEVFTAALQSSAFVCKDIETLIDIALSYIPADSTMAKAIKEACRCYKNNISVEEARIQIHNAFPGTFGIQGIKLKEIDEEGSRGMVNGEPGFDAPENVAYVIASILYGKGDFEKSLLIANSFGEDTDCICATLCATLGIMYGEKIIPSKWKDPLDDKIKTCCIKNTSIGLWIPDNAGELTERILRDVPMFLGQDICDVFAEGGMKIKCQNEDMLYAEGPDEYMYRINSFCKNPELTAAEITALSPYVVRYRFPTFYMHIDYCDSVYYSVGTEKKIIVRIFNDFYWNEQQWVKISVLTNDNITFVNGSSRELPLNNLSGTYAESEFIFIVDETKKSSVEFVVMAEIIGRHSTGMARIIFKAGNE